MNDLNGLNAIPSRGRKRKIWWYLISAAVTLVFVGILVRLVLQNLDTLAEIRTHLRIWPMVLTFPVFCVGQMLASLAWGMVMNKITKPLSMSHHFKIYMVTNAGRRIPGGVWHVVGRVAWYERLGVSKGMTIFANVLETILIIWSGLIMALSLIFYLPGSTQKHVPFFIGGIILITILMHPRIIGYVLKRLGQGEQAKELNWRKILLWLFLYLPIWLTGGTMLFLVMNGIYSIPLELWPLCIGAYSLAGVAGMLILILPSGFGLNEATTVIVLSTNIPVLISVAGAILLRILITLYEFALAGLVFILFGRKVFTNMLPYHSEQSPNKTMKN